MVLRGLREVVVALAGTSAAIAGFVLVFLGILITTYQELLGRTGIDNTLKRLKVAARAMLAVFAISLASLVLDVAWLASNGGDCFYYAALAVFFGQLGAVAVGAGWTTLGVLLRG